MRVNLISDVHATLDPEDGFKVLYAQKQKHTRKQCKQVIDRLVKIAHSCELDPLKTREPSETKQYLCKMLPKSNQEYLALVDDIARRFQDIDGLGISDRKILVDELNAVKLWHYIVDAPFDRQARRSSKVSKPWLDDVISWVMKTYTTFDPAKLEPADYLIIAGDLGVLPTEPLILEDIKKKTAGKFKDILYVAGNHSHWWHMIPSISEECPESIDLSNDYCERVDGDWLFLGCTLWTPIPERARWRIERHMNDYRYIPHFTAKDSSKQFEMQSSWLRSRVNANTDKKIVIFTHHQPFKECIKLDCKHNDPWSSDNVAEAYADLDDSFADINQAGNIKAWLCGHTHMPFDQEVYGIRVVRNPVGYSDFYLYSLGTSECDPLQWYNKIIDFEE